MAQPKAPVRPVGPIWSEHDPEYHRARGLIGTLGIDADAPGQIVDAIGRELDRRGWKWKLEPVDHLGEEDFAQGPGWIGMATKPLPAPHQGAYRTAHRARNAAVALTMTLADAMRFDAAAATPGAKRAVRQVQPATFPSGDGRHIAVLSLEPPELAARYGLTFADGWDNLDYCRTAEVGLDDGSWVLLIRHAGSPEPGTEVIADANADLGQARQRLRETLGLTTADLAWWPVET